MKHCREGEKKNQTIESEMCINTHRNEKKRARKKNERTA